MGVIIKTLPEFDRKVKRLAKKYKSLKQDLQAFALSLLNDPLQGKTLGKGGVRKVRMAISSKGGGKSGGARILTYVVKETADGGCEVTLMTIYDKSEIENVSDAYIGELVSMLFK